MSKKIKLQDLSFSNFDQQPDVEGIKGGAYCQTQWYIQPYIDKNRKPQRRWVRKTECWTKVKGGWY